MRCGAGGFTGGVTGGFVAVAGSGLGAAGSVLVF